MENRVAAESKKGLPKPNNIITIPTKSSAEFFRWWCIFLRPLINLTSREIDVVAAFLKYRQELSQTTSDPIVLDTMTMSEPIRQKVIKDCDLSTQHFYVVMSNLRKHKIIVDNVINPRLIPNIRKDDNGYFQLLILFR